MRRRDFHKTVMTFGTLAGAGSLAANRLEESPVFEGDFYRETPKRVPVCRFDVVITGGSTAGVVAALASAAQGARSALIEAKGYTRGTVSGGNTALHRFYKFWKPFAGGEKLQAVCADDDHVGFRGPMCTRNTISCMAQG